MQYITNYNPDWPRRFAAIAGYLRPHLGAGLAFHHVGSTSVPGMVAKDIIDLDIECPIGSMPEVIGALRAAGYEHEGDKGIPTREAFRPLPGSAADALPAHHLYACEADSPELRKHLAYRDYLIAHPGRTAWLAEQKIEADRIAARRDEYIENKSAAYAVITRKSLAWAAAKRDYLF